MLFNKTTLSILLFDFLTIFRDIQNTYNKAIKKDLLSDKLIEGLEIMRQTFLNKLQYNL